MTIKNKILFRFLLPTILVAIATTAFCYCCAYKMAKKNILEQLEIAANQLYTNTNVFLSGKKGRTVDFSSDIFVINCTEETARKKNHIETLHSQLFTNKKPLDTDIPRLFVDDLGDKVTGSTRINKLGQDDSDNYFYPETMANGSSITGLHYFS